MHPVADAFGWADFVLATCRADLRGVPLRRPFGNGTRVHPARRVRTAP